MIPSTPSSPSSSLISPNHSLGCTTQCNHSQALLWPESPSSELVILVLSVLHLTPTTTGLPKLYSLSASFFSASNIKIRHYKLCFCQNPRIPQSVSSSTYITHVASPRSGVKLTLPLCSCPEQLTPAGKLAAKGELTGS